MANTYTSINYHLIFSTKDRVEHITPEIEQRIWGYIGGVAHHHRLIALKVGGTGNHIHALVAAPPILSPSQIAQYLKGDSSKWIHKTFPALCDFAWQEGYGAFSVSQSHLNSVVDYIENQREHHRRKTFQEEYLAFLRKHGVQYDERYLWT